MKGMTAILLCGGKGVRLRPITEHIPKPMVPLLGRPILQHLIQYLAVAGIRDIVVCTGYKSEVIETFLKEQTFPKLKITVVNSGDVGMPDRILDASVYVEDKALVCYGDTIANVPVEQLAHFHNKHGGVATLSVHPFTCPFGVVDYDTNNTVLSFTEKPTLPVWVNIGFMVCEKSALQLLKRGQEMTAYFEALRKTGKFYCFPHRGKHLTVNTENELKDAEKEIANFYSETGEAA